MSNNEPNKIIFSMVKVSKFYDKKPVLKDIYLSFFYGAKIGVLGLNGSGKSSLFKIIAGTDKDFNGEVVFRKVTRSATWNRNRSLTNRKQFAKSSKRRFKTP
ncbi:MAG: ATP-binding cassette domain-containing protein [Acidobacteria bacterium]|nr:ATP-binding cassette domain-containing protein [Acidobacteriota bacterium]